MPTEIPLSEMPDADLLAWRAALTFGLELDKGLASTRFEYTRKSLAVIEAEIERRQLSDGVW